MILKIFIAIGILAIVASLICVIAFDGEMNIYDRCKDNEHMHEASECFTVSLISLLGFLSLTSILTLFV